MAWKDFLKGKRHRKDVQEFERNLMTNIITLHGDLVAKTYRHSPYHAFNISDPKPRNIHKAAVRDRLVHHTLHRGLYPFFDRTFSASSFSCRVGKGTHKALDQFQKFSRRVSKNHTRTAWVLKCDIRKFFASIDQSILLEIVGCYISDVDIRSLIAEIVGSFHSTRLGVGLPLGNLTSQLLVNIYLNEFDQFVKHQLKAEYYVRYADDFVFLSEDKKVLLDILSQVRSFLKNELHLELHPSKVSIHTLSSGVDFLGWIHFPNHRILRTATKKRMFKNIAVKRATSEMNAATATTQSYLGLLSHGNAHKLKQKISKEFL